MTRRALATGVLAVLAGLATIAQGPPNFSGAWTLDKESSAIPQMGGGPGGPGGRMGGMAAESIVVKQTAAEITREAKMAERTITRVYKLDGTESVNDTPRGQLKTKSKWDGAKLVTSGTSEVQGPNGAFTLESTETMMLDAQGHLVIETVSKTPMGERTTKLVYKKAS
jgi:hypothetical protein